MEKIKYEDKELIFKGMVKRMEYSFMNDKNHKFIPYNYATFEDSDGKRFEYRIDFKAKTPFACSLNDVKEGDTVCVTFQGEEHYRKAKDGSREYYNKMTYCHLKEKEKTEESLEEEQDDRFIF